MLINLSEIEKRPHPKFEGVKIGFITTKENTPELSITLLEIEPGIEIPTHTHEKEVDTILVLNGEGELYFEGKWLPLKKGDVIVIKQGKVHGVKNKGNIPLICYIVHAPALW
ncbi:MAG: cupin domain-containing protein [Caldimicrobium sp.]|jgi:quercetin dioxygenase-like cupin family protein|uniref:Cupin n=1 Tax=Caldimicrobium thiodismutans TaxID=1653476 RepID=A0A2N7PII5_9BACT|nr:MAG: cupin [Caldimicrobium thiodismutans]